MAAEARGVRRTAPRRKTAVTADEAGASAPAAGSVAAPATRARRKSLRSIPRLSHSTIAPQSPAALGWTICARSHQRRRASTCTTIYMP